MLSSRSVTSTVKAAVWEKGRPALDSTVILPNMKDSAFVASKNQPPQYIVDLSTRTTYLKGKFLDKGGFARVHELTDLTTNIVYAGKIIPKNRITKPHYREKIVREIELHRTLKHANVVGFHHFFEDEDNVYIILENCAHKSLVHVVRHRRSLTEPEVRYYMKQLISGVQYIHNQNVIHRDLKLGNMFLSENLIVKIGDFGLATRVEQTGAKKTTICGTPNYIAPEVLSKQGHTRAADVWAIGCIMYAMLVGQPPFESGSLKATYSRIANNNFTIPPLISSDARSLITNLLHPDPNQRLDLSSVLQHPFFTRGFTPQTLPSSSCIVPPKFHNTAKSCSSATTSPESLSHQNNLAVELRKLTRTVSQLCLSGSRNDIKFNNTKDKLQSKSKKENSIQNTFRQKLNNVLGTGKKSKPLTAAGLYHHLSIALNTMPQPVDVAINQSIITNASVVFISKWIDYSNKYGFGFQLCDQNIGVLFNDGSKIGFSTDRTRIEFYDCEGKMTAHSIGAIPVSLVDHYTLLKYFAKYMDENLTEGGTFKSSEAKKSDLIPVMQRWIRTTKAIIMQLSSGTIQVNFFKDHTKVILSEDKQDVLVTFIDENRESNTFQLSKLVQNGCPSHLYQRLLYVLSMLTDFAQLESTDV